MTEDIKMLLVVLIIPASLVAAYAIGEFCRLN